MTHDQENERNAKWLLSIITGLEASNSGAEAMAQKLYNYAHGGGMPGELTLTEAALRACRAVIREHEKNITSPTKLARMWSARARAAR
jgi:hypothetical protein